jgi:pimeloyl-ACP methyl ester carboxylesterase
VYRNDSLYGIFSQNGFEIPLNMGRSKPISKINNRPQEPIPPYPYQEKEVVFNSLEDDVQLAGTLTIPKGEGPFPAVILISGSGPQTRNEEFMGHQPFLVLADYLTRNGIVPLRFDDRGFGESTGNFEIATSADFANDVRGAVSYLEQLNQINIAQIGLIGHSEGGLIAPMVAAGNKDINFIILMAGPAFPGEQILLQQVELMGKASGLNQAQIEGEKSISANAFKIITQKDIDTKTQLEVYFSDLYEQYPQIGQATGLDKTSFVKNNITQLTRPWMKFFLSYDPAENLSKTQCPVLAINGSKDVQMDPQNLKKMESIFTESGNDSVTIIEYKGMNHLFQEAQTGLMNEYNNIEHTISEKVLKDMVNWIYKIVID